jgi:lipoyl(octanoyl) transferase
MFYHFYVTLSEKGQGFMQFGKVQKEVKIKVVQLGRVRYEKGLAIQERLHFLRVHGIIGDTLLLLEHPPVMTLGRRGNLSNILFPIETIKARGIDIFHVTRGGDVTYHGPGQIVGYPIVNIHDCDIKLSVFIENMKNIFILLLADYYGIKAHGEENVLTGVWVGREKITAIGLAVKQRVTMHGFAFNVNTDLTPFQWINPCGLIDRGVTSLQKLLGRSPEMSVVTRQVAEMYCRVFGGTVEWAGPEWVDSIMKAES